MEVKVIKEGLLIPKKILEGLGLDNFEILTRRREIILRAKTKTRRRYGFVGAKKINEELIKSFKTDWEERAEIETF